MRKLIWLGLIAVVVLLGCSLLSRDFYRTAEDFPENGKGMLVLVLDGSDVATHTIAPSESMDIGSYVVSGLHENLTDTFTSVPPVEEDATPADGEVYTKNDLKPGVWTIKVTAFNGSSGAGDRIGFGSNTVNITPNSMELVTVEVGPDTGEIPGITPTEYYTGGLTLSILWPEDSIPQPYVYAELIEGTPYTSDVSLGTSFGITTTSPTTTAALPEQTLNAGYYDLNIELYKNNDITRSTANRIMGDYRSVRIVYDLTTDYTWDLTGATGDATITISPDLNNPIPITLTFPADLNSSRLVSAELPTGTSGFFTYEWYEDGQQIGTWSGDAVATLTSTHTLSDFTPGTSHNLSVVVTEYDAADISTATVITISSEAHSFTEP